MVSAVFTGVHKSSYHTCVILLGHSDVLMGAVCTNNAEFAEKMKFLQLGQLLHSYV